MSTRIYKKIFYTCNQTGKIFVATCLFAYTLKVLAFAYNNRASQLKCWIDDR